MPSIFKKILSDMRNVNKEKLKNIKIVNNLKENVENIKNSFSFPKNNDIQYRDLYFKSLDKNCALFYMEVMTDTKTITQHIIHPIIEDTLKSKNIEESIKNIIKVKSIKILTDYQEIIDDILLGYTILFVEGYNKVFSFDTILFESRSISASIRENVIKGPQESFVESSQKNLSLIRKQLKDENLINEVIEVGKRAKSKVNLLYISNIIDDHIVNEVKSRLKNISIDCVLTIEILEQLLEESPKSLFPTFLYTERPDRAIAYLVEGHVVLFMENSSAVLILPVTFWALFQSPEDMYLRWPYGNFVRFIRFIALFLALLTPSIYVGITLYHIEMMPTDLLLAIAGTRERVPFPVIFEVVLMEISFEILRESGIRIPSPLGSTIGIVGALILGQAAVQANIVSPILVIIVAITGLSSFAITNPSLNYLIRIVRFGYLLVTAIFGFLGIATLSVIFIAYLSSHQSFGVAFLSPISPYYKSNNDVIFRPTIKKNFLRPFHLNSKDKIRMKKEKGNENN